MVDPKPKAIDSNFIIDSGFPSNTLPHTKKKKFTGRKTQEPGKSSHPSINRRPPEGGARLMETSSGSFCHKTLFNQSAGREIGEARPETRPLAERSDDSLVKLAPITRLSG